MATHGCIICSNCGGVCPLCGTCKCSSLKNAIETLEKYAPLVVSNNKQIFEQMVQDLKQPQPIYFKAQQHSANIKSKIKNPSLIRPSFKKK